MLTLFVAENGEFRSISNQAPGSGTPPAFGTGTIESETAGRISGAYVQKRIETVPTSDTESCTLDGTLTERVSMSVTVTCTDSANQQKRFSTILGSDANYSADGSSLSAIAGNYTLPPAPESNVLNINGDGTVFGLYKNGAIDCTVNGLVSIIDAAYNLYRVEWTLSNCASTLQSYEGVTMTGFTYRILVGPQQGSILVLLSGAVGDRLDFASLLYEPT
ncbi:MAG TPA: hypothetical protein VFV10_12750 [Gammaproteobacteria bacterium]|nr:hypothetical protein [Gammaproteobacteria bacterium]